MKRRRILGISILAIAAIGITVHNVNWLLNSFDEVEKKKQDHIEQMQRVDKLLRDGTIAVEEYKTAFYKLKQKRQKEKQKAIEERRIVIGMNQEEIKASWGTPLKINRSVFSWGIHEQWVYYIIGERGIQNAYLYFEDGKLTGWQD